MWSQLYEKIGKSIERYVTNENKIPSKEIITMRRAQLDLHVSWQQSDSLHMSMLGLEPDKVYSNLMVVKVRGVSKVNEYIKTCPVNRAQDDSMEYNNTASTDLNRIDTETSKSLENPIDSSEKPKSTETIPIHDIETVILEERSIEVETCADEQTGKDAGSLQLIARLPYQPREREMNPNHTNFDDEIFCDDYEERQIAMIQSEVLDQELVRFSADRKSNEKREIERESAADTMNGGNEVKKKRYNEVPVVATLAGIGNKAPNKKNASERLM